MTAGVLIRVKENMQRKDNEDARGDSHKLQVRPWDAFDLGLHPPEL